MRLYYRTLTFLIGLSFSVLATQSTASNIVPTSGQSNQVDLKPILDGTADLLSIQPIKSLCDISPMLARAVF